MFARALVVLGCAAFASAQQSRYTQSSIFLRFTLPQCADGQYQEEALPEFDRSPEDIIRQVRADSSSNEVLGLFRQALDVRLQYGVDVIDGNRQCALDTIAREQAGRSWTARLLGNERAQGRIVVGAIGAVVKKCAPRGRTVLLGRGASRCALAGTPSSILAVVEASHDLAVHTAFHDLTDSYANSVHAALRRVEAMLRDLQGRERSLDACSRRLALSVYGRVMLYVGRFIVYPQRADPVRGGGEPLATTLLDRIGEVAGVADELARADGCTQPGLGQ